MLGLSSTTCDTLAGLDHLHQSVADILTTPIGSRVGRRDYGSRLFGLIDRPMDAVLRIDLIQATVEALAMWEPRLVVTSVEVSATLSGVVALDITGVYRPEGRTIRLDGVKVT